jgi:hypothetical protein
MASIFPRHNKDGTTTWRMMIRRKGYPTLCKAFATQEEAIKFAQFNEETYCTDPDAFKLSEKDWLIEKRKREFKQKRPGIYGSKIWKM